MSETVTRASLIKFVEGVFSCFGQEYLRRPNNGDLARLLHVGADRGFPGMVCSIDCMHWEWKNCPTAWAGQYAGRSGKPTIILEAVASYDLWIWHAFFGTPGTCNDINVLQRSPVFDDVLSGQAPHVSYVVNDR
ncbi:putative harbinger transposase-derived protein [Helianthus annuus]|nr:putative harbinger transposase-derived protein [Helianthus annuus]KAJ0852545.1 putative harbinger transposase-derived protein [Helianthus annuus]